MNKHVLETAQLLGEAAAEQASSLLNDTIAKQGYARIILSTGASQFPFFEAISRKSIDWSKVEMFHLDEYIDMPETHKASFRKYLKERFLSFASVKKAHFVDGEGDVSAHLVELSEEIRKAPIDLALIGIGENAHIAFNDPPADFETKEAYKVVELDAACRQQQLGEGWFESLEVVPTHAITMTVHQIMASKTIISVVPHAVKAQAIRSTLAEGITNTVPATILKTHGDWHLYLDQNSASLLPVNQG
ncbi:6-phosphogluconolactonase [Paenibacillus koleovorans]|uniref:6-phosphogluconolactonase n=1 Tax=Paenibacillus koleovorans TaxID=121608 RepID=UPI000FDBC074|nr:6-phosphogluconolactonase [Paenibacillus koleovorans]